MDEKQIRQIVQEEINQYMIVKQYNISKIPGHEHNGVDTVKLPTSSMVDAISVTGTVGGVLDPLILDTQTVNRISTTNTKNPPSFFELAPPVIYGFGVGVHSAFNGGLAEERTMIVFSNGGVSTLWFMLDGTWRGVNLNLSA